MMEPRPRAMGSPRSTKDLLNKEWEFASIKDIRFKLSVFDRFVPVIGSQQRKFSRAAPLPFLQKRQQLFDLGLYPGVEYRVKAIVLGNATLDSLAGLESDEGVMLEVRPAYNLIPQLERDWPVLVPLEQIPWCLSRGAYNVVTVAGSVSLATSFLFLSFLASLSFTLSVVNTRSMEPAIMPKDVMLVEKVSPTVARLLGRPAAAEGDIVFFNAPPRMTKYIQANKLPKIGAGSLLVKRVDSISMAGPAAVPGRGQSDAGAGAGAGAVAEAGAGAGKATAMPGARRQYRVLGDNPAVSLDSRTWGPLDEADVVGRPLLRVLPLGRFGLLH